MRYTLGPYVQLFTTDAFRIHYGYPYVNVVYVRGTYITAPPAGSILSQYTCPAGRKCAVIGVLIDATESNYFDIIWQSDGNAKSYRLRIPSDGILALDFSPGLNIDEMADGNSTIIVRNVGAGGAGSAYKVELLIGLI